MENIEPLGLHGGGELGRCGVGLGSPAVEGP